MGLPSSPIKIWGKSVQWFLSYDRTNKHTDRQTNRDYNFINKDNASNIFLNSELKRLLFNASMFDFFVCPFVSNKPQNGWTNRAQMFCGNSQYPRNGLWTVHSINITHGNVDLNYFINYQCLQKIRKIESFTIPKKKWPLDKQNSNPETVARIRMSAKRPESLYY